jgi:hypothetical protein
MISDLTLVFKQLYDGSLLEEIPTPPTDKLNAYTQAIYIIDNVLADIDDKEFIGEVLDAANFFHILLPITDAQNWLDI